MNPQDINKEMDELERVVQDLKRNEGIEITYDELYNAFRHSKEVDLSEDIWNVLENTESNDIQIGDMKAVHKIAHMYHKTNPDKLAKVMKEGTYNRPMILNYDGDMYHLVAGNTRLCTAKALGITPKVYIAVIDNNKKVGIDEIKQFSPPPHEKETYDKIMGTKHSKHSPFEDDDDKTDIYPQGSSDWNKGLKKKETKEQTCADSSGAFEAPLSGGVILKRDIHKLKNLPNTKTYQSNEEDTIKESATADISAASSYDVPLFGVHPKGGRKNPLKIDGPESIYKGRAVKDKKFPKFGGPGGVFVKIKEKCKKFPYCNQGDINAIEVIREAIDSTSKKYGISVEEMEKIVINEITKIFI